MIQFGVRSLVFLFFICASCLAEDKTLTLSGAPVTVRDVSADVDVTYSSMRLNRALNVWNVEISVRNKSTQAIQGPIVFYVDGFANTSGPLQPDGADGANSFYDLSSSVASGVLAVGQSSAQRTLTLGKTGTSAPTLTARVFAAAPLTGFAVAHVRTLDSLGHPLGSVTVEEIAPKGQRTLLSSETDGIVTLGQGSGAHVWKFSREGYLPSYRREVLTTNKVSLPYSPRLTQRSTNSATFTLSGGVLKAGGVEVGFGPGAFSQATVATLTPLNAQSLPALLPLGWSPVQAFWLEFANEPIAPGAMNIGLWGAIGSQTATLVKWSELGWIAVANQSGNTNVSFSVAASGAYAVVVGDTGAPAVVVGEPLPAVAVDFQNWQSLTAIGTVTPSTSPASRVAELVTAAADVTITNAGGAIPSGLVLRSEVEETYAMADGTFRVLPKYETQVIAYQQPGDRTANTASAAFPLRPILLLAGDELKRGEVKVDVFPLRAFNGGVFGETAGQIAVDGVRILSPGNSNLMTVELSAIAPTNFHSIAGTNIARAFQVGVGALPEGRKITAQFSPGAANAFYVLGKVISRGGLYGVEPVERFSTDASGNFSSVEPVSGERLNGIRGSGQYLLVRVSGPQGLVHGVAKNALNQGVADLPIRSGAWLTFSEANGVYRTIAPVGTSQVNVTDLATGDTTATVVNVSDWQQATTVALSALPVAPRIVSVSPANGETNVAVVSPIVIEFSEPVNPASLLPNGIVLLNQTNAAVAATLTLNLRGNVASLLPNEALAPNATHTIAISTNVADLTGLKLQGTNVFAFKTRSDELNRGLGAQVISFEPTNGVARIDGTQGIADPGQPVVLVNDTTGETTTVLSKTDGSFQGEIRATTDDFLSAVFVNLNGTRNVIPVSRQNFADGRVGLFNGGGILEAQGENGAMQVLVEPGAIPNKTIFKIDPVAMTNLPAFVKETAPQGGKALGGFKISIQGDLPKESVDVSFPVTAQQLGLPSGMHPTNATYGLAIAKRTRDLETGETNTVYELVDRMQWEDGKLVTHSPPFFGLLGIFEDILVTPLLMTVGNSMTVHGRVYAAQLYSSGKPIPGTERWLPGAFVSVVPPNSSLPGLPGRIRPGAVFASAGGTNASYAMMVPVDQGGSIVVRAVHPAFPGQDAIANVPALTMGERFIIGNILTPVDLVFPIQNFIDNEPPHISVSHTPDYPQVSSNSVLRIVTTDNASRPRNTVLLDSATSLDGRTNVPLHHVSLFVTNREDVGAFGKREYAIVSAAEPAIVKVYVKSTDDDGNARELLYPVIFGGSPLIEQNPIPAADTNDVTGPRVISSVPSRDSKAFVPGQTIVLKFDEPIDKAVLREASTIFAMMPGNLRPVLQLNPEQDELSLYFHDLRPDTTYTLTANSGIRDISGNALDQDPTQDGDNSFTLTFKTAKQTTRTLPELQNGGGVVVRGIYAYALERNGTQTGKVLVYDLSNPSAPNRVAQFSTPPFPRDLVLIPQYAFKRQDTNTPPEVKDLLAVVGGRTGLGNRPWLSVIDISNPLNPERLTSASLSANPENVVSRVHWDPPVIGYIENSSRFGMIGIVDLQTLIISEYLPRELWPTMPRFGEAGVDLNGDGDYVDAGETLPKPAREPIDFSGKIATYGTQDTDQWIRDFALDEGGSFISIITDAGHVLGTNGLPTEVVAPPSYRTLVDGTVLEREAASFIFTNARPKAVSMLPKFPMLNNGDITTVDLALVSIIKDRIAQQNYTNALAVLDVTDSTDPRLIVEIPMPPGADDNLWKVQVRDDGLLMAATDNATVLIDPLRFKTPWDGTGVHPAIAGVIPGLGDTQTFGGTLAGLNAISSGGKNTFVQTAPSIQVIGFATNAPFNVQAQVDTAEPELIEKLQKHHQVGSLFPARYRGETAIVTSAISPPVADAHYFVIVRAPGSAGATINLALESLNWTGVPLRKRGFLFPPVHALAPETLTDIDQVPGADDAPVRASVAYRLSSNPASDLYNVYLSRPFVLANEEMSKAELAAIQNEVDRDVIWAGDYLRISIDPSLKDNQVVGAFASRVEANTRQILPGVELVVPSFRGEFIQSPNPGPMFGGVRIAAALNAVNAHSGELVMSATDMTLPGRRLPIEFTRTSASQALFDGPFGRGWDFNFNQRIVELNERLVPAGKKIPLVVRGNREDEIGLGGDLLFYTGGGRVIGYRFAGTNAPAEIAQDPLVLGLGWTNKVARYYLPPAGIFSIMLKFKDGRFVRVEPDGRQYWFNGAGRLAKIYDRFDKNSIELAYNTRGELIRIFDELKRPLEVAYHRLQNDPERRPNIDVTTTRTAHAGKIARLIDYSKRDILYHYTDDGLLERREGPLVETAVLGGFTGRQSTRYAYSDASQPTRTGKALVGVIGGDDAATPLISATEVGLRGRDTVSKLKLANGNVEVTLAQENTARKIAEGNAKSRVVGADGGISDYNFDSHGRATSFIATGSGTNTLSLTNKTEYYTNGLVKSVTQPEGNRIEYYYDSTNPSIRSRGNLVRVVKNPGPRGGAVLEATTQYDNWYNLPAGEKTDFNGNVATIILMPDHRETERITRGGLSETYVVNEFGLIESHTAIDGITRGQTYTPEGFIRTKKVGPLTTTYNYAPNSGVTSDQTLRGLPSSIQDPEGFITEFTYDERNQLVRQKRGDLETSHKYNAQGDIVETRNTVDRDGETLRVVVEENSYNQVGFRLSHTVKNVEVATNVVDLVETFEPDAMGRLSVMTAPGGDRHITKYDSFGRIESLEIEGVYKETYEYDRNGNKISKTVGTSREQYFFDGHDRRTNVLTTTGARITVGLDGNGNLTNKVVVDADGRVLSESRYKADELDRYTRVERVHEGGVSTMTTEYFPAARKVVMTDAMGAVSTVYYDDAGREVRTETPTITHIKDYDGNNNLKRKETIENGRRYVETYDYNDRNQLTNVVDNAGFPSSIVLGIDGRVKQTVDREGHSQTNEYTLLGELAADFTPNGSVARYGYDTNRISVLAADTIGRAVQQVHDASGRLLATILPNGETTTYTNFNALLRPEKVTMPRGIAMTMKYDAQGRMTNRVVSGIGPNIIENYAFNGIHKPTLLESAGGSIRYVYDRYEVAREFQHHYDLRTAPATTLDFTTKQSPDLGGYRATFGYPGDSLTVTNVRDNTGRLEKLLLSSGEPIIQETEFAGDRLIGARVLGNNRVRFESDYDALKRPIVRRYKRISDGKSLVDVRYAYDKSGAQLARQFIHRAGRADFFQYDGGYRLRRADIGARPQIVDATARQIPGFTVPATVGGQWAAGLFARVMDYDTSDMFTGIQVQNPDNLDISVVAETFGASDVLGFVSQTDQFNRSRDVVGNVTRARLFVRLPSNSNPVPVSSTLEYNALGQLSRIVRDDGVEIVNEYSPLGLRIRRIVTGDPARCVPSDQAFIYDGSNLIEIRDLQNNAAVIARFYYGDEGDELIAGDLANGSGSLERHYFLGDTLRSILAVTDATGHVIERASYDVWGQPTLQTADNAIPTISRVTAETNTFLVEFTEPVLPTFAATSTTNLQSVLRSLQDIFVVRSGGVSVAATIRFEESLPPFGSVFRVVPNQPLTGIVELELAPATVQDEANNANAALTISLNLANGSNLFTGASRGSTAPTTLSRSATKSPFAFHGQVFDYDSGLLYCRARFYDPYTAMFLQRDPAGFVDGVNHYAGFANNPVNLRDPSGLAVDDIGRELSLIGSQASYKEDGIIGAAVGSVLEGVGAVLQLGTGAAEGQDILENARPGTFGILDAMKGAELMSNDVKVGMGAFGSMYGFAKSIQGRIAGYMHRISKPHSTGQHYKNFLYNKGWHGVEPDAIVQTMKEMNVTEFSVRDFNGKAQARKLGSELGYPKKPGFVAEKTSGALSTVTHRHWDPHSGNVWDRTYTGDLDIFSMKIGGRRATPAEVNKFITRANLNYAKMWRKAGNVGVPNVPFRHGAHFHLGDMYGQRSGGKMVDYKTIEKIGHPGDTVTIRIDRDGQISSYQTPRGQIDREIYESEVILKGIQEANGEIPVGFPPNWHNAWPKPHGSKY
jgi:RHS repeat-associated protein